MDTGVVQRENRTVLQAGGSRRRLARTLNEAYAGGLLSDDTFVRRVDQLLTSHVVDPIAVVGDINLRSVVRPRVGVAAAIRARLALFRKNASSRPLRPALLALDWSGAQAELLIGRHHACDVMLSNPSVSRRHARLVFRDDKWIIQDLQATNGTFVNGTRVGRCELRPGDCLLLGEQALQVD
jgi:hypothetical protein